MSRDDNMNSEFRTKCVGCSKIRVLSAKSSRKEQVPVAHFFTLGGVLYCTGESSID